MAVNRFSGTLSFLCICVLFTGIDSLAQTAYLTGNLEPGPYEVGFKVEYEYDYSRTYNPDYNEQGELLTSSSPRPMQIGIWYPAQRKATDTYMLYRDYYYLDATAEDFSFELDETAKLNLDQRFQYQNVFTGTANPDILHRTLDFQTRAIRDAEPLRDRYPLIIYSPREYRGVYYNSQLIEYLVSHGFVVAATPNKDNVSAVRQSQVDADILLTNLRDLQFVKGYMIQSPSVDADRVATVGWAWGAMSSVALAMADQNVKAVVSLDGGIRFPGLRSVAQNVPKFSAVNLTTPLLHIETVIPPGNGTPQPVDFTFYDAIKYADTYHLALHDATWFSMSSFFNLVHGKGVDQPAVFDYESIDRAYDNMSQYTLHFLKAFVTQDLESYAFLEREPSDNGVPAGRYELKKKEGLTPVPSEAFFVQYFLTEGSGKALTLWNRVMESDATAVISSANGLNGLGYQLIGQGEMEEAIVALKLQADTYPWLANAWDSLGEGYMANGDDDLAIESFRKSLTMNPPQNVKDNSISLLGQLGEAYVAPEPHMISEEDIAGFIGSYKVPQNNSTVTAEVEWNGTHLTFQMPGQTQLTLVPQTDTMFWAQAGGQMQGIDVEFAALDHGVAGEVQIRMPGNAQPFSAPRIQPEVAESHD